MTERKVYISSTYADYKEIREKFSNAIRRDLYKWYKLAWVMEDMRSNGANTSAVKSCMDEIKTCDIYILIIGDRYGSVTTHNGNTKSYTEHEFDAAVAAKTPSRFVIYSDDNYRSEYNDCENDPIKKDKLVAFRKKAEEHLRAMKFSTMNEVFENFLLCLNIDIHKRLISEQLESSTRLRYMINRTSQDKAYDAFNDDIDRSVVPAFIFTREADKPDFYSHKIWITKFRMPTNFSGTGIRKPGVSSTDSKGCVRDLVKNTVHIFLGQTLETVRTLEMIMDKSLEYMYVPGMKLIEIEIDASEIDDDASEWIEGITTYINQLQALIYPAKPIDKVYVILRILYEGEIDEDFMSNVIDRFKFEKGDNPHARPIDPLNLSKLENIDKQVLKDWVTTYFTDYPNEQEIILEHLECAFYDKPQTYLDVLNEFNFKFKKES